jgi:hypothetical protein
MKNSSELWLLITNFVSICISILEKIPATFWGVVIGSFFSILGVALSNRASDKRQRSQFDHEHILKTKEREMALRKDIYLAASEAIAAGANAIARIGNLDLPNDQVMQNYEQKAPAILKVHLIGNDKTVKTLADFTGEMNAVMLKLLSIRFNLVMQKNGVISIDTHLNRSLSEQEQNLELLKQYNIDGYTDHQKLQALNKNIDYIQRVITDAISRREILVSSLYPKQIELMQTCLSENLRLSNLLIPVVVATRLELELPLNEESYSQVIAEGIAKQESAFNDFVQNMPSIDKLHVHHAKSQEHIVKG